MTPTPQEFLEAPLDEQVQLLFEQGNWLTSIRYYSYKVNLYELWGYYFEVFVNHKRGIIERIALLDEQHSRMKFYLDQIRLSI